MALYYIEELRPSDPSFLTDASCINSGGLVGGSEDNTQGTTVGVIWPKPSNPRLFPLTSAVNDLNDSFSGVADSGDGPVLVGTDVITGGLLATSLVPPLASGASPKSLNNNYLIAGVTGDGHGFVYNYVAKTPPVFFGPPVGMTSCRPSAINNSGAVVGNSEDFSSEAYPYRGFLYAGGELLDLGAVFVSDINDSGVVVGEAGVWNIKDLSKDFSPIPFPPGFSDTSGFAINNNGDVVGACFEDDQGRAFVYTGGVSTDLNTAIPGGSGWQLLSANDINDSGQIVGTGLFDGQQRGFLLTPNTLTAQFPPGGWQLELMKVVPWLLGSHPVSGSGIVIVGGKPVPVGPWGRPEGNYVEKSEILISLAMEEMATQIENIESQVAARRDALERARTQIDVLLAKLRERR